MNWHLSTDPERPNIGEQCAVVLIDEDSGGCEICMDFVYVKYSLVSGDEEFRNYEFGFSEEFKDTIAWISKEEILNDFKEFYKLNNKPASPPTQKQLDFIESICEELDIEFTGTTKEEARQFISSHIDEFELANEAYALEHEDAGDRPE